MCDPRHAPDTLFIVLEEDFRLYKHGGTDWSTAGAADPVSDSDTDHDPLLEEELYHAYTERLHSAPFTSANPLTDEPVASEHVEAVGHGFYTRTQKTGAAEFDSISSEIEDIVKLCTAAKRQGKGDLVWLTWDGGSGKKTSGAASKYRTTHPFHASTMVAISHSGAKEMQRLWDRCIGKGHMDVVLLRALMDSSEFRRCIPACFVYPSVGHYRTHHSAILSEDRVAMWTLPCVQEGTRKITDTHKHRTLHEFCAKGWPPQLGQAVVLPEAWDVDLRWFTYNPDHPPESTADEPVASAKGKGKKQHRTVFATENPTQHGRQLLHHSTKRQERQIRAARSFYSKRCFTSDFDKAWFFV